MAALAAFHRRIHVGHVEAGLRSYDLANPFPEEANRKLISVLASLHFAPSPGASDALVREGIDPNSIHMTGNTVIDALRYVSEALGNASNDVFEGVSPDAHVVLVTAHRRENWGEPLRNICRAIRRVALNRLGRTIILFVCHPNPAVRKIVDTELAGVAGVMLSDPLDYLRMVRAIRRSDLVVTDSGGLQEEAPTFGKPVLVIREKTERVEAIAAGTALLIGTQEDRIVCEINRLLDDAGVYEKMARAVNPYGDGQAALRIVDALEQWHATG
jgi:UDP-N-acetylglucosamine 2-epimerase (non-hydrolysing)